MSALDNIEFYNPFLENLKKIDGLVVCKTKNDVEIHCCIAVERNTKYMSAVYEQIKENIDCCVAYNVFLDDNKGYYCHFYVDGIEYVTIIVQFVE